MQAILWLFRKPSDHLWIAGLRRIRTLLLKRPQDANRGGPDCPRNGQELHDVDPSLAALVLGDKRLVFLEPLGEVMLRQIRSDAGFDHQLAKRLLAGRMDGFAYTARARCHRRGRLIRSSDYPKMGYILVVCAKRGGLVPGPEHYWSRSASVIRPARTAAA
jgi:hypothetical protein